jgi:hypothetical protein
VPPLINCLIAPQAFLLDFGLRLSAGFEWMDSTVAMVDDQVNYSTLALVAQALGYRSQEK